MPVALASALPLLLMLFDPVSAAFGMPTAFWKDRGAATASERPLVGAAWVRTRDVAESLRDVLSLGLGYGAKKATEVRLPQLKEDLRPMYAALPKNSEGFLGQATVRYAMHRHFSHHHGMYLKGLGPDGEVWNSSSPAEILEDRVPSFVIARFEQHLQSGLDLEDLALLAAALEHFMHMDALERLRAVYRLTNHSIEEAVSEHDLTGVLERFMVLQTRGFSSGLTAEDLEMRWRTMVEAFPTWPRTQEWLRSIQESVLNGEIKDHQYASTTVQGGRVNFEGVTTVLESVMDRYGRHQDSDCKVMAGQLIAKEDATQPGRVKLSDFYQTSTNFVEKKEYLRELGAIEEHRDAAGQVVETYVLIPNYLQSAANCLPSSNMYTVCCLNPCEELLRHVEIKVGKSTATPSDILEIVAALPSSTVPAPRVLPDVLMQRLREIAVVHELGGQVHIHGRLFSQWLHHAYPHECPMPAKAGTTRPMTAADWLQETNTSSTHTQEEIDILLGGEATRKQQGAVLLSGRRKHVEVPAAPDVDSASDSMCSALPWDLDEELVFQQEVVSTFDELRVIGRAFAMIGASGGLILSLAQLVFTISSKHGKGGDKAAAWYKPGGVVDEAKMV